ncbi:hypothetical protein D3C76_1498160 [compost metagenome]
MIYVRAFECHNICNQPVLVLEFIEGFYADRCHAVPAESLKRLRDELICLFLSQPALGLVKLYECQCTRSENVSCL